MVEKFSFCKNLCTSKMQLDDLFLTCMSVFKLGGPLKVVDFLGECKKPLKKDSCLDKVSNCSEREQIFTEPH